MQSPQDERECGQSQIRFRLTATRGEEEQIDDFSVGLARFGNALEVHQDERQLEGTPCGRDLFRLLAEQQGEPPATLNGHCLVGETECFQAIRLIQ